MSRVFFISDLHFGHKNIMGFAGQYRHGDTYIENIHETIKLWNSVITKQDKVYILGDVCFHMEYLDVLGEMAGRKIEAAEVLIQVFVETVGIQVASELVAEEVIRTRVDYVQGEMKRRINERLAEVNSGIRVEKVEMDKPTPPLQVLKAFERTQRAENDKQKRIRHAEQERTKILSETAGAGYPRLIRVLNELEKSDSEELRAELDRLLEQEVEGRVGEMIKDASAYLSVVVGRMESDVEEYRTLVPEYERNAALLVERLWEQARDEIFASPGVIKLYRPAGLREFRVHIPLDPEQTRIDEEQRLQEKEFDASKLRPKRLRIVGPEYD